MKRISQKIWGFLKPPMSIREAKQKGLNYLILIVLFYLVRDLLLYVILPYFAYRAIF